MSAGSPRGPRRRTRRLPAAIGIPVIVLLLQLVRPAPPGGSLPGDGTIGDHLSVPPEMDALLRAACYDCHSDGTRWPWYARVAPVSWLVAADVRHGRSNLDFSRWSVDPVVEPTPVQRLTWMCDDVRDGTMPPWLYRLAHPEARLDAREKASLCAWTADARAGLGSGVPPVKVGP